MKNTERTLKIIYSGKPIGCCGGHTFRLFSINGGYSTECTCGLWCGQWFESPEPAIEYFKDMIERG